MQRANLVVHQGDQWRDDHGHAQPSLLANQGRNLVAKRFATAGRHQHQGITTRTDVLNDGLLRTAKRGVAEHLVQRAQCGGGGF